MTIHIVSAGLNGSGQPRADIELSALDWPNPPKHMRAMTGLDPEIQEYVLSVNPVIADVLRLAGDLAIERDQRLLDTGISITCSVGKHRSVVGAEWLATYLRERGHYTLVTHLDLPGGET